MRKSSRGAGVQGCRGAAVQRRNGGSSELVLKIIRPARLARLARLA